MIPTSPLTNALFCRSAAAGPHDKLYTYASRIAYATHQRIVRHHLGSNKHLGLGGSYSPPNKYPPHPNKPGIPSESGLFVFRLVGWQKTRIFFSCLAAPLTVPKSPRWFHPTRFTPKRRTPIMVLAKYIP